MTLEIRPFALGALVLLVAACSGGKETAIDATGDDDTVGDDDDTTGDDDDTTTSEIVIDGALMFTTTVFGYDATTDMAVPTDDATYGPLPILFTVVIGDTSLQSDPSGPSPFNSCNVVFGIDTPQPLTSWPGIDAWWGFEIPANAEIIYEDCSLVTLPAEFGGDAAGLIASKVWGTAVDALDPSLAAQFETQLGADWAALEPYMIGGGTYSSGFVGALNAEGYLSGYGVAYEADANFAPIADGTGALIRVPAAQLYTGTLNTAIFSVQSGAVGPAAAVLAQ
jgi:hypothetical protein